MSDGRHPIMKSVQQQVQLIDMRVSDIDTGTSRSVTYTVVRGVVLVPASHCTYFNMSRTQLGELFASGRLTPYTANGKRKHGDSSVKVYFDLRQWLTIDFEGTMSTRRRKAPVNITI